MGEGKSAGKPVKTMLPKMTTLALKGKQSVRVSFKLSKACILAINIVAIQLGIKHRSLFDYLVKNSGFLDTIGGETDGRYPAPKNGIQKTYIISRETLSAIDVASNKLNMSRDALIELSARRLAPLIEKEKASHYKRKHLLEMVQNHYTDGTELLRRIKEGVGAEDPIYKAFQNTTTTCEQVASQIRAVVVKGKILEDFNPDSLRN